MLTILAATGFMPTMPAVGPHTLAPRAACTMRADSSRREALASVSAALLAATGVGAASAKSGEFGKISIFGVGDVSSPYQVGGPKAGKDATFGYAKSEGPLLATG
jgi:hypothetical protein